jgi:hypothetical protein
MRRSLRRIACSSIRHRRSMIRNWSGLAPGITTVGTPCHRAPGERSNPIVDRMLLPPPLLLGVADNWSDKQRFWIVKTGLKYTGMPSWVALERDAEVWAVVESRAQRANAARANEVRGSSPMVPT